MNWRGTLAAATLVGLSTLGHAEVVLESDDNAAVFTGTWAQATNGVGFYGTDFATAVGANTADTAKFVTSRPITTTGVWCIQARWTSGANRTPAAQYQIFDGTTLRTTFTASQRNSGGVWRRLGCVPLTAGKIGEVRLSARTPDGIVVADGVRWVWEESIGQNFCVAVGGGFGAGGTTFIGKGFATPANGQCKSWAGIMKTATTVVGTSTGAGCMSDDGKLLTITLRTTAPSFLGPSGVSDQIELCPAAATLGCPVSDPAAQIACTAPLLAIPSVHD